LRNTNGTSPGLHRRRALVACAGFIGVAMTPASAMSHSAYGPVTPRATLPAQLGVTPTRGPSRPLRDLLQGHVTAVQLMFTGCSATCPIQGAIFADVQALLTPQDTRQGLRLLSVSIDPLGDDLPALTGWLRRFGARPSQWLAALPSPRDVDPLLDLLRGRASGVDRHTAQAFLFDRQGRLALRTPDLPPAAEVARLVRELAAAG
jgi:protein SCO1